MTHIFVCLKYLYLILSHIEKVSATIIFEISQYLSLILTHNEKVSLTNILKSLNICA